VVIKFYQRLTLLSLTLVLELVTSGILPATAKSQYPEQQRSLSRMANSSPNAAPVFASESPMLDRPEICLGQQHEVIVALMESKTSR
jgi:hypothetical protein